MLTGSRFQFVFLNHTSAQPKFIKMNWFNKLKGTHSKGTSSLTLINAKHIYESYIDFIRSFVVTECSACEAEEALFENNGSKQAPTMVMAQVQISLLENGVVTLLADKWLWRHWNNWSKVIKIIFKVFWKTQQIN